MKAVFLERDSLDCNDLDLSSLRAAVAQLTIHANTTQNQVAERIAGFDIIIVNKLKLTRELLTAARPKFIGIIATGVDNVDLAACTELGITVCNCQGYGTDSVAQHTLMLMLALSTRMLPYQHAINAGQWQQSPTFCLLNHPIAQLAGKHLVIVGYGTIGQRVAALAEAFGMTTEAAARPGAHRSRRTLPELLPEADFLSLHCPLTNATRGLIGADELRHMKPSAYLINTGRGGLVDEQALAQALKQGTIAGAGMDVLAQEPPTNASPLLQPGIPNLIITPHNAWAAQEARQTIVDQLTENIRCWQQQNPIRVVSG